MKCGHGGCWCLSHPCKERLNESRMDDLPARLHHLPVPVVPVNECHDQGSVDYRTDLGLLVGLPCYFRGRWACLLGPAECPWQHSRASSCSQIRPSMPSRACLRSAAFLPRSFALPRLAFPSPPGRGSLCPGASDLEGCLVLRLSLHPLACTLRPFPTRGVGTWSRQAGMACFGFV